MFKLYKNDSDLKIEAKMDQVVRNCFEYLKRKKHIDETERIEMKFDGLIPFDSKQYVSDGLRKLFNEDKDIYNIPKKIDVEFKSVDNDWMYVILQIGD